MKTIAILAIDSNNGIGKDNNLPWPKNKEDMKFFRLTTEGSIVIMGRKTFLSMGSKPLKNRFNIIISSKVKNDAIKQVSETEVWVSSYNVALNIDSIWDSADMHKFKNKKFVIGGSSLYNDAFSGKPDFWIDEIYLTRVNLNYNCDTFVKLPNKLNFKILVIKTFKNGDVDCQILHWTR